MIYLFQSLVVQVLALDLLVQVVDIRQVVAPPVDVHRLLAKGGTSC